MRSAYSVLLCLLLVMMAFGCSDDELPYGGKQVQTAPTDGTLNVMSYNVEDMDKGNGGNSTTTYKLIAEILRDYHVDVVCFYEIQPGSGTHDKYGDGSTASNGDITPFNKALVAADYVMPYYAFDSEGSIRRDFIAMWSKIKPDGLVSVYPTGGAFDPSTGNIYRQSRPILKFRIRHANSAIWIYGCHLKSNNGGVIEQNAGNRRAQAFHLARYIMRNQDPEKDLIIIMGDMNTMPEDYDGSGNSTIDYLCLRYDNPFNTDNDFIPVNLNEIGAITNLPGDNWGAATLGTTFPGKADKTGYPDATFDHIIVSPKIYANHYRANSINIIRKSDGFGGGASDHFPVMITLENL